MAPSGGFYNINLKGLYDVVDKVVRDAVIDTALLVQEKLRSNPPEGTPIDTGWASNNWILTADVPSSTPAPRPSRESMSFPGSGVENATKYTVGLDNSLFVYNNAPYITKLNEGSSSQSPEGFVDAAVDSTVVEISRRYSK